MCLRTDIPGITDLLLLGLVTNLACEQVSTNHKLQPLPLMRVLQHTRMNRAPHRRGSRGHGGPGGDRELVFGKEKVPEMDGLGWLDNSGVHPRPKTIHLNRVRVVSFCLCSCSGVCVLPQ